MGEKKREKSGDQTFDAALHKQMVTNQPAISGVSDACWPLLRCLFSLPPPPSVTVLRSPFLFLSSLTSLMQPIDKRLSVFTPTVIRELTHKKYDRRKVAALEVER